MWGQWNVYTEQGEMFQDGHMRNSITPTHSSLIKYTPKEEIGDSKHIYIINVYSHDFFTLNNEIGLKCISPEYIEDIRNGKCKILMFFIYEGYSGIQNNYDFEMIEISKGNEEEGFVAIFLENKDQDIAKVEVVLKDAFTLLAKAKNSEEEGGHGH